MGPRNDAGTPVGQSARSSIGPEPERNHNREDNEMNPQELGKPFKYSAIVGIAAMALTAVISLFS